MLRRDAPGNAWCFEDTLNSLGGGSLRGFITVRVCSKEQGHAEIWERLQKTVPLIYLTGEP